jgi:hypothetical protein
MLQVEIEDRVSVPELQPRPASFSAQWIIINDIAFGSEGRRSRKSEDP